MAQRIEIFLQPNWVSKWIAKCRSGRQRWRRHCRGRRSTNLRTPRQRILQTDCKPRRESRARKMQATDMKKGNGAPERIRTSDPQIRSLVLYPAELRARLEALARQRRGAGFTPRARPIASAPARRRRAAHGPRRSRGARRNRGPRAGSPPPPQPLMTSGS